jgi:hypothetical protein
MIKILGNLASSEDPVILNDLLNQNLLDKLEAVIPKLKVENL